MKTIYMFWCLLLSGSVLYAQKNAADYKPKLGVKAGYNWSYLTGSTEGINQDTKSGFMIGAFYAPVSKGRGFRTEIVFSRQGYSFENGGQNTDVQNDYIYLPQLGTFGIGKFLQLQLGAQIGFLLNSKLSKSSKDSTITDLVQRLDYGFAGGLEVYPLKGLLVGGRYNLGLGKLYKHYEDQLSNPTQPPYPLPFNPETTNFKNGVVQFYVGYRF
jgi:hypothetical protein